MQNKVKRTFKRIIKRLIYIIGIRGYKKEIERRSKLSVFDYKELSKEMRLVTEEYGWNAYYDLANIVKRVIGLSEDTVLEGAIEHGILRYNEVADATINQNIIFAFGYKRMQYLQQKYPQKRIYSVGPYIQYVDGYLSENEIDNLKAQFKRTLVVFTSHSIPGEHVEFDVDGFIGEIERIRIEKGFDTVIVSLHWRDIQAYHLDEKFIKMDYKISTCGSLYDTNFLPRLKSVIDLSDMVMANDTGSYLGYTIALGKPFYLYYLRPVSTFDVGTVNAEKDYDMAYYEEFITRATKAFGDYKEVITGEEISFVEDYWGKLNKGLMTINEMKDFDLIKKES